MKQFDKGIKEVRPHRILLFSEAFDCPITNQDRQSLTLNVYRVTIIQAQGSTSSTCPRYLFSEVVEVSLNGFKYGMHFQIMSAIALIANALQKYKKQMRICHLRTDIFEKNIVSTVERHKKWQETTDKMANPLCVGIETTSFRPRRTGRRNCGMIIVFSRNGRCRKQRFLHDSIRKRTRNSVAKSKPQGEKVETMYPN